MARAIDLLPAETEAVLRAHTATSGDARHRSRSVAHRRLGRGPQSFRRLRRRRTRAVSVHGAAARVRRGDREVRRGDAQPHRAAAVARRRRSSAICGAPSRASRGSQPYASATPCCLPRSLAHYIQDAHQPLHATNNYDGQLTGNNGIHARFETALFERFQSRLTIRPAPPAPIPNSARRRVRRAARQLPAGRSILKADKERSKGKDDVRRRVLRDASSPQCVRSSSSGSPSRSRRPPG